MIAPIPWPSRLQFHTASDLSRVCWCSQVSIAIVRLRRSRSSQTDISRCLESGDQRVMGLTAMAHTFKHRPSPPPASTLGTQATHLSLVTKTSFFRSRLPCLCLESREPPVATLSLLELAFDPLRSLQPWSCSQWTDARRPVSTVLTSSLLLEGMTITAESAATLEDA